MCRSDAEWKFCVKCFPAHLAGTPPPTAQHGVVHVNNLAAGDDRTMQTRTRLRKKLSERKASDSNNSNSNSNSTPNTKISSTVKKSATNGLYS